MRRSEFDTRPAPRGMTPARHVSAVPPDAARWITGFLPPKHGKLEEVPRWVAPYGFTNEVRGLAWFHDEAPRSISATYKVAPGVLAQFQTHPLRAELFMLRKQRDDSYIEAVNIDRVNIQAKHALSEIIDQTQLPINGMPSQVLTAQDRNDLCAVYLPASYPYLIRRYPNNAYLGWQLQPDISDGMVLMDTARYVDLGLGSLPEGYGLLGKTVVYRVLFVDENNQLCGPWQPSAPWMPNYARAYGCDLEVTVTSPHDCVLITIVSPDAGQFYRRWTKAIVYRALEGTRSFYATRTRGVLATDVVEDDLVIELREDGYGFVVDFRPDSMLELSMPGPGPSEYGPPQPCSAMCMHMARLVTNDRSHRLVNAAQDAEAQRRIWLSHISMPNAFNYGPSPTSPEAGGPLTLPLEAGDSITAVASAGGALIVWSERAMFTVSGTGIDDAAISLRANVGCVGQLTVQQVGNHIIWMARDGVYRVGDGFSAIKISEDVENLIIGPSAQEREAWEWQWGDSVP